MVLIVIFLQRKRGRPPLEKDSRLCSNCGTSETPEWRKGPLGPHTYLKYSLFSSIYILFYITVALINLFIFTRSPTTFTLFSTAASLFSFNFLYLSSTHCNYFIATRFYLFDIYYLFFLYFCSQIFSALMSFFAVFLYSFIFCMSISNDYPFHLIFNFHNFIFMLFHRNLIELIFHLFCLYFCCHSFFCLIFIYYSLFL